MKRAVITGGTGMLGLALINKLIEENVFVTVIMRPESKRACRIPVHPNINTIPCALNELSKLENILTGNYDYFFHFAWDGTFGNSRNDMFLQNQNISSTLDAVELANKLNCSVFLGAGSQAEYGRVDGGKIGPKTPTFPENGYGMAKLCAGQMSRIMCEKYGIRHNWVRIFSTYGPNDGMHTMVTSGIRQMLENKRPSYTLGEQMWDYLYCADAAEAFYLTAKFGRPGAVYCLGSGQVRRLSEYITDIRDIVSPGSEIGFGEVPYYENQVMYLCADIESLSIDTGFKPKTDFKEGIKKTAIWVREVMDSEKG